MEERKINFLSNDIKVNEFIERLEKIFNTCKTDIKTLFNEFTAIKNNQTYSHNYIMEQQAIYTKKQQERVKQLNIDLNSELEKSKNKFMEYKKMSIDDINVLNSYYTTLLNDKLTNEDIAILCENVKDKIYMLNLIIDHLASKKGKDFVYNLINAVEFFRNAKLYDLKASEVLNIEPFNFITNFSIPIDFESANIVFEYDLGIIKDKLSIKDNQLLNEYMI